MKSWIDDFKKEVDEKTKNIQLRKEIFDNGVTDEDFSVVENKNDFSKKKPFKPNYKFLGAIAAAIVFVGVLAAIIAVNFGNSYDNNFYACVVEINPSLLFITDEDGVVKEIKSLNGDGDVIISDEDNLSALLDKDLKNSLAVYTDIAAKAGFIKVNEKNNVVKLSGYGIDEGYLKEVENSLINGLSKNGIYSVVLSNIVEFSELKNIAGVKECEENKIEEVFSNLPSIFAQRGILEKTADELQSLYKETVIAAKGYDLILKELKNNLTKLVRNADILLNIATNNLAITLHADNPQILLKDYWSVKNKGGTFEGDFLTLMQETEDLITTYEEEFGVKIGSFTQFAAILADYSALSDKYGSVVGAISSVTKEDFYDNYELFVKILKNAGCDVEIFETAFSLPQTVDEFIEGQKKLLLQDLQLKIAENDQVYSAPRNEINESDYREYINDIVERYGSLENFCKNK